jgi:hypothetical protein
MRRLAAIPIPYALAGFLAVVLAVGLYAGARSDSGATSTPTGPLASQVPASVKKPRATVTPTIDNPRDGKARGVALLSDVRRIYARVPAVVTTSRLKGTPIRFTSILKEGVVVGESFVGPRGDTSTLVALPGTPTFAQDPGTSCWRLVPASDPQALTDIGSRFPPYPKDALVEMPQRTQTGWSLRVDTNEKSSTFDIDSNTLHVRSITLREAGQQLEEHVSTLASAPALPSPQPRC